MSDSQIDLELVQEVMQSAIDTHIHSLPSFYMPGKMDDLALTKEAVEAGMASYVSKNAQMPTVAQAALAMKVTPGVRVYGSIALNSAVGGINPEAVNVALGLGARCVAANHLCG